MVIDWQFRRVVIITVAETPQADAYPVTSARIQSGYEDGAEERQYISQNTRYSLFPLKHPRQVLVVRNIDDEVSTSKAEASCPERI